MARVAITSIAEPSTEQVRNTNYSVTDVDFNQRTQIVKEISHNTRSVREKDFGILRLVFDDRQTKAETILPFRIRFSSVDLPGYGRENPPPIGIAIVGLNNYIL